MNIADEIEKLNKLRQQGAISEEEYQKAKEIILRRNQSVGEKLSQSFEKLSSNVSTWSMLIHISQLCGFLIPVAGVVVPIILWQLKKRESEIIDTHGRIVANWILTVVVILGPVFILRSLLGIFVKPWNLELGVLSLAIIGGLVLALVVGCIVFAIIGAVKAYNGEVWPYPYSFRFFKVES